MIAQDVTIPVNGFRMPAYLARPEEESGPHPAVIVLQEVFGFTPEVKRVTELLPAIGYAALAINFYHRTNPQLNEPYTEEGNRNAFAAAARVEPENLVADVRAAADWLNAQPFVKPQKIATWGFGFGATAAFLSASMPEIRGSICFYPGNVATAMPNGAPSPLDDVSRLTAPLLLIFGEKDYYVSRYDMDRISSALTSAGKEFKIQTYPDVGHSFFRHGRPEAIAEQSRYSDEAVSQAVADSWNLVQAFLRDVFNRPQSRAAETGDIHTPRTESLR